MQIEQQQAKGRTPPRSGLVPQWIYWGNSGGLLLKRSPQHSQKLHPWNCLSQLSDSSTQRVLFVYSYLAGLGRHGSQKLPESHEHPTSLLGECIHLEETALWCIWQHGHLQRRCLTPDSNNVQAFPEKGLFDGKAPTELKRKWPAMASVCPPLSVLGWTHSYSSQKRGTRKRRENLWEKRTLEDSLFFNHCGDICERKAN